MSDQSDEDVVLRRYLLADLDEQRREQIEKRLFNEQGFSDELAAVESSLIDDYVFEALSQADREKFERNFILNAERKQNLRLAEAFKIYLQPEVRQVENEVSWWKSLLAWLGVHKGLSALSVATVVVVLVFITPLAVQWFTRTDQPAFSAQRVALEHQLAELNRRPFPAQSPQLPSQELTLKPDLLRGGPENERLEITREVVINLRLALSSRQYDKYTVVVRTAEDEELFSIHDVPPNDDNGVANVLVRIPSDLLPTNDYLLDLRGISADGSQKDVALYNLPVTNSIAKRNAADDSRNKILAQS